MGYGCNQDNDKETGQFGDRTQRGSTQVRWFGQDLVRAPDSGIGYTQDHRTRWSDDGWVEPDSYRLTDSRLMGRKRLAGGRLATRRNVNSVVHRMESQWGIPHKRALFGSDGPDSTSSSSDVVKDHYLEPPDDGYPVVTQSGLLHENDSHKEAWSPSRRLEVACPTTKGHLGITGRRSKSAVCRVRRFRRRQFPDFRGSLAGNNTGRCFRPLRVQMAGMTSQQLYSCCRTWMGMLST